MAACGGPTSVSVAAFLGEGRRGPGALRRPVARRSGRRSAASGWPLVAGNRGVLRRGTWMAWHVDDAGGCRPTAASGGPGCGSRLTGVLAPRVEACEEFCNSFGVPETSPLWRRLWSIGAWRSLASALDWGSRGRRFKSCRPDVCSLMSLLQPGVGLFRAVVSGSLACRGAGIDRRCPATCRS